MLIISKDGLQVLNMDNVIALTVGEEPEYENNIIADYPEKMYLWEEYPTHELAESAMKALVWRMEQLAMHNKWHPIHMPTNSEAQEWADHEDEV